MPALSLVKRDTKGSAITSTEQSADAAAIESAVNSVSNWLTVSGTTARLWSFFDGDLYWLTDTTDRDAAYIADNGILIAGNTAGSTKLDMSSQQVGDTKLQIVIDLYDADGVATGFYTEVSRADISLNPSLSNPLGEPTGQTTADYSVSSNYFGPGSGTVFGRLYLASATLPTTGPAVEAGTGAVHSASSVDDPDGTITFPATGLSAATDYVPMFVQKTGSNYSNIAQGPQFTTEAAGVMSNPEIAFNISYNVSRLTQTGTVNLQNRPLVIFVLDDNTSTSSAPKTVTVNGNNAPQVVIGNRSDSQASMHFVVAPGANATASVSVTCATFMDRGQIIGVYVDGMTAAGVSNTGQRTGTFVNIFLVGATNGRKVLAAAFQRNPTSAISCAPTADSGEVLLSQLTAGNENGTVSYAVGWCSLLSSGTPSLQFDATVSASFIGVAAEFH